MVRFGASPNEPAFSQKGDGCMKLALEKYGSWLSAIVRLHAYAAATFLVIYMVGTITFSFIDFFQNFDSFVNPKDASNAESAVRYNILHSLAFIIVLYKAFSILVFYGNDLHVNIKFIIEIAIIGSVVELIFNYKSLSDVLLISYAMICILVSIVYLFFYDTLEKAAQIHDSHKKE